MGIELPRYAVIDGAMGTELTNLGHAKINDDVLWSARLLDTCPSAITQVHESNLEAGADIIITASYQASIEGFVEHCNKTVEEAENLIRSSVDIANQARDKFWQKHGGQSDRMRPLVAGSVGPWGACTHDGSEYTGNYVDTMSVEQLMDWHRPRMRILSERQVDIVAIETLPAQKEAEVLAKLLREFPSLRAWVTFSCKNDKETCHGEAIGDAWQSLMLYEQVVGVGLNCVWPQHVSSLLSRLPADVRNCKRVVVYPNSGEVWDYDRRTWQAGEADSCSMESYIPSWLAQGAQWIGGCCLVGSSQIRAIRSALYDNVCKSS